MNFSAVILAGGKSSRMGRDKALLDVGGQTLLVRQIETVRAAGATEIFISGRPDVDYSAFGCRVLKDRFSDAGPLAGIEAALNAANHPLVLMLAVDLAEMPSSLLRRLAAGCTTTAGVVPVVTGLIEPLAAFYPKASLPQAQRLLGEEKYAVRGFAESCAQAGLVRWEELHASRSRCFANWNFPADLNQPAGPAESH